MKPRKKTIEKIKIILKLVLDQVAEIYLYFLGFYLACLIVSLFFERWKLFFNWGIFHLGIIVLGILSLLSDKGRRFISFQIGFIKALSKVILNGLTVSVSSRIKTLSRKNYIKTGLIIIILALTLYKGISPINFLILGYALVSVLFVLESRIAAVIALLFLVSCPVLLILKKEPIAETTAIYAYYFLVITVATQIGEYWRDEKKKKTKKILLKN